MKKFPDWFAEIFSNESSTSNLYCNSRVGWSYTKYGITSSLPSFVGQVCSIPPSTTTVDGASQDGNEKRVQCVHASLTCAWNLVPESSLNVYARKWMQGKIKTSTWFSAGFDLERTIANKKEKVAWIASHCNTMSRREEYVGQLARWEIPFIPLLNREFSLSMTPRYE